MYNFDIKEPWNWSRFWKPVKRCAIIAPYIAVALYGLEHSTSQSFKTNKLLQQLRPQDNLNQKLDGDVLPLPLPKNSEPSPEKNAPYPQYKPEDDYLLVV